MQNIKKIEAGAGCSGLKYKKTMSEKNHRKYKKMFNSSLTKKIKNTAK